MAETPVPRRRRLRGALALAGVLLVAAGAAAAVYFVTREDSKLPPETGVPTEVSTDELRSYAASLGHVVYWAGPRADTLELTATARGDVFVRYLPAGVRVGDARSAYTTIGTYPLEDAYDVTTRRARTEKLVRRQSPGRGIAVWSRQQATSVYLVYPGSDFLVEVYDPKPARARRLAFTGTVGPIK